jgi:SAM-dependent methyltransferase
VWTATSAFSLARERAAPFGGRVRFSRSLAGALAIEDASVDVVIASLVLHHLAPPSKLAALHEARRVLVDRGRLIIADWGRPHDPLMRACFAVLQLVDGFQGTRDHAAGRLPGLIAQSGFDAVHVRRRWRTMWGSLELICSRRGPASSRHG